MGAVFFSLILLTASTMAQSVRERRSELALLRALGFSTLRIGSLIVSESVLMMLVGGVAGLALASLSAAMVGKLSGGMILLPTIGLRNWGAGLSLMLLLGIAIGLIPVIRHSRSRLSDALSLH
jgi:putative ABC transport system permease protein